MASLVAEAQALAAPPPPPITPPCRTPTPEPWLPPHVSANGTPGRVPVSDDDPNSNPIPSSDLSSPPVSITRPSRSACARSSSTSLNHPASASAHYDPVRAPASTVSSGGCPNFAPVQPKTIVIEGIKFDSWPLESRPDAPTLGEEPKRRPDGSIKPRTKREAEDQLEFLWQKKRKLALEERLFNCPGNGSAKFDMNGTVHFEGEPLPEWLHAERELQDDGRPGTFIVRPNKEHFEGRWPEILRILEPFGMRLGIMKLVIPPECLGKAIPYSEYVATRPPPPPPPKPNTARKGWLSRGRVPHEQKGVHPTRGDSVPAPDFAADTPVPQVGGPPTQNPPPPMVYTMSQHLPLHLNSKHRYAPIYEVVSKHKTLVPISSFPHDLDENSQNFRIPEETMLKRGRKWADIAKQNPGGEVFYSSDNDVTDELRSYLGLVDPKLDKLPENHVFDSTETVVGIHTPYLYLGNPYTMFALHQEDYCALSLNFHHRGAPKMWRVTCPLDFDKVERLVARNQDEASGEKLCSQHVRHASLFLSQGILELEGIRSILVRQKKGEMIITWPLSYHQGWNEGPNICEAIAYGSAVWKETFAKGGNTMYRICGRRCVSRGMGIPIQLDFS